MPHSLPGADEYALKRDFSASTRLTAQFHLWKESLRYNMHPSIPLPHDARIADVATGNGIWLLDMVRDLPPTVKLHGFDISLDQCPPKSWLPANVEFDTWDIFADPPKDLVGPFDVVHVRLITLVIRNGDPSLAINNLHKLLKPGGFLQWDEVDTLGSFVESVDSSSKKDAIDQIRHQLSSPGKSRGLDDWKRNLPNSLNQHGFQDSKLFCHVYDLAIARYWNDMYVATWDEFARTVLRTPEETKRLGVEAMEEARSGSALMFPKLVWVAQKSLRVH